MCIRDSYFSNALLWALVFALPFMLAGIFCPEVLLRDEVGIGQDVAGRPQQTEDVLADVDVYKRQGMARATTPSPSATSSRSPA